MISRFLPAVFVLSGLALLGLALVAYVAPTDGTRVTINEPEREFLPVAGEKREVVFRIQNPTSHSVRVVGLSGC